MKTIKAFFGHIKRALTNPAEYRKAYAAAISVLGYLVSMNVFHGSLLHWLTLAIGVAGVIGVGAARNAEPPQSSIPPSEPDVASQPSDGEASGSIAVDTNADGTAA